MLPRPSGGFYKLAAATSSPIVNNADARLWRTRPSGAPGPGREGGTVLKTAPLPGRDVSG
jgi:hypothetical protein